MSSKELHDALVQLDAELRSGTAIADEDRALLEQVRHELATVVDEGAVEHDSLRERLNDAIERFEAKHPGLANMMAAALDAFNKLGV